MSSPPPPGAPGRPSCRFAPLGVALLGAALLAGAGCGARDTFDDPVAATLPAVGAVVTEHPLATKAGLLVLEAGGNAADAAVAAALTLAVVFPQAGNLGGGGFAVWVPHRGAPETLDFRETAPSGYTADLYLDERGEVMPERSLTTPLAVGVPGSPHGLFELYRRHGTKRDLSFARLCDSAIRLAEDGFGVDPWLADTLATPYIRERLAGDPGARAMFYPGGEPLGVGDRLKQPALARTLRLLASRGASGFYRGPIAEAIVADLVEADARAGGVAGTALLSASDLAGYSVKVRRPVVGIFRGHTVYGMAPPASGGVALLQMLGMLEGLPLDAARRDARERVELGLDEPLRVDPVGRTGGDDGPLDWTGIDARTLHWWIEAMRRAFADRAEHLGDPDQFPVPTAELLSPEWIAQQRISISERADLGVRPWVRSPAEGASETTHISVIDSDGNAVSLTTTLNGNFGSGIYVEEAGFFLNNELDDFSIQSGTPNMYGLVGSDANQLTPLRRPLSSMCPIVVRDAAGDVRLVLGAPGGPRIITAVTQVLLRVLAYEQDLVSAIRAPRIHQQWRPQETRFERGFDPRVLKELEDRFDQPVLPPDARVFGSVQGIRVLGDGSVRAYSDPRRGGAGGLEGEEPAKPALLRD